MDIRKLSVDVQKIVKKYKFPVLIVLVGVLLMAIPSMKTNKTAQEERVLEQYENTFDKNLSALLSNVAGAGSVKVLLTTAEGEETIYQTDVDQNKNNDNENYRSDTVTFTQSNREQQGLVRQVKAPVYRGAIIICQGADSADVRLCLVDAVSKITGLRSDQISVLKMK